MAISTHIPLVQWHRALAIVAAGLAAFLTCVAWAADPVVLDKPRPIRLTLADGRTHAGQVARWDDDGFEGTVGRFRWDDLKPLEAYRVRGLLIDLLPPTARLAALLEHAAYLWSVDGGETYAERVAKEARGRGADDAAIAAAKARSVELSAVRRAKQSASEAARLRTTSPEAGPFPAGPWPAPTPDELERQLQGLRQTVLEKLALAGREVAGVEGDACIVWSDLGVEDAARRAVDVDAFLVSVLARLGIADGPSASSLRPGKIALILLESEERYRLLEAAAFNQAVAEGEAGIAHYLGSDVVVVVRKQPDEVATLIECCRGAARGVLHRLVSPARLPPWAHEGLVDGLVMAWKKTSSIDRDLRKSGLAFIRGDGSLEQVADLTYDTGSWPGPRGVGRPAGYLLVGLLMEQSPHRFLRFVGAVKSGKEWRQAMREDFGASVPAVLQSARVHYRFND